MAIHARLEILCRIDEECRRLRTLATVAEVRLGQVLTELKRTGFAGTGITTLEQFSRDRLGCSARSAQRTMALAKAVGQFAHLKEAFLAGKLSQSQVLLLLPVLEKRAEDEEYLVELATRLTLRELQEALVTEEPGQVLSRTYQLTAEQRRQLEEALDLARAMQGDDSLPDAVAFEAMGADLAAGLTKADVKPPVVRRRCGTLEAHLEELWRDWDFLGARLNPFELLERELPRSSRALQGEAVELSQVGQQCELAVGELLYELHRLQVPTFADAAHFARERLGYATSTARAMLARERLLRARPALRQALRAGELTLSQVDILRPAFERGLHAEPWIAFAGRVTCRALKDWTRYLMALDEAPFQAWCGHAPNTAHPKDACPPWSLRLGHPQPWGCWMAPLNPLAACWILSGLVRPLLGCPTWLPGAQQESCVLAISNPFQASLVALEEIMACWMLSAPQRRTWRITAPREVMLNWLGLEQAIYLRTAYERPECLQALVLTFLIANRDEHGFKGQQKRLLLRDRFSCCDPGCTKRSDLHSHHTVFRSRGGDNSDENLPTFCYRSHGAIHRGELRVTGPASKLRVERDGEAFLRGVLQRSLWATLRRRAALDARERCTIDSGSGRVCL